MNWINQLLWTTLALPVGAVITHYFIKLYGLKYGEKIDAEMEEFNKTISTFKI